MRYLMYVFACFKMDIMRSISVKFVYYNILDNSIANQKRGLQKYTLSDVNDLNIKING